MENYVFCTTKREFLKIKRRSLIEPTILFFLFLPFMIIRKNFRRTFKEVLYSIFLSSEILGFFDRGTNTIAINLESHYSKDKNKIIEKIISTIIHEDLHKALNIIGHFSSDYHHFIIGKMGY